MIVLVNFCCAGVLLLCWWFVFVVLVALVSVCWRCRCAAHFVLVFFLLVILCWCVAVLVILCCFSLSLWPFLFLSLFTLPFLLLSPSHNYLIFLTWLFNDNESMPYTWVTMIVNALGRSVVEFIFPSSSEDHPIWRTIIFRWVVQPQTSSDHY